MIWDERTFAAYCDGIIGDMPRFAGVTIEERVAAFHGYADRFTGVTLPDVARAAERAADAMKALGQLYADMEFSMIVGPLVDEQRRVQRRCGEVQARKRRARQGR